MLPHDFHPVLRRWWEGRFGPPTEAQSEGWSAIRRGEHTLIAAPTGSGKTLAAFLTSIDQLFREGVEAGALPDEVRVIYVSPLKALSADIHKNLAEPRREIRALAEAMGIAASKITAAVRSGDTPQNERAAMLRTPPHILVTTPESLYLLMTAARSRDMLRTARVVIVDEIHAVLQSRRGAHLSLTLERLDHLCGRKLQRIGLSATQKPIEEVGRFLVGNWGPADASATQVTIVDRGHKRKMDLAVEIPRSPLEAVMSHEVWQENYDRLVELIGAHRTTLITVNTRRLAERMAHHLSERLGEEFVAAHHGSLSKEMRLDAEHRLREGKLKVLVATASLELGIDIGHVDLVCQISSPHRIATFLQRVGRSGHFIGGVPKGRIFPLTRDDLIECAAMVRSVYDGELDRVHVPDQPLDVLAQQIVAEVAAEEEWDSDALYALFRKAYPYRALERGKYDEVVDMLGRGFATKRGRRAALLHHDSLDRKLRPRRGSRMNAIMNGGAIPEVFDFKVIQEPEGHVVGSINEDFAIESLPGDVFQLGNTSWRILRIGGGAVRVADAKGQPPTMPFWLGEAPARSAEMSAAVSKLRGAVGEVLPDLEAAIHLLERDYFLARPAAEQIATYLDQAKRMLGVVPTTDHIALERFFDESGGMQLVLHAPFGSRINRAWGLALRKKFCQGFNFELQAAATEEGLILSLSTVHSFPLEEVFRYLNPDTVRETLTQAILQSPIFETRWRWSSTLALAVPRNRGGVRVPNQLQRMFSEDVLQAVFPEAVACQDNLQGAREIPDHPLVNQAMKDALEEAVDASGLEATLRRLYSGEIRTTARDTPEPSVLSHELLNSAVYTFLDDAPLEERRTRAVHTRRSTEVRTADDLGALDAAAIERVRQEAWPVASTPDEMYDALMVAGYLRASELAPHWKPLLDQLGPRAVKKGDAWLAHEREGEDRSEIVASRMEVLGPVTERELGGDSSALPALEGQGRILRGRFTPGATEVEWCDRRLLARIHRYTLSRLRAEIEPVTAAEFMRFLAHWQHVAAEAQVQGPDGLAAVVEQLEGFELAATAWEHDVLRARVAQYGGELLDQLCVSGRVAWGRLTPGSKAPLKTSPIALLIREHGSQWASPANEGETLGSDAAAVRDALAKRGASFFHEIVTATGLLPALVERGLAELAGAGIVTADSFAGLRALLARQDKRRRAVETAGRWSLLPTGTRDHEAIARTLLKRYGVVFRSLLQRENGLPPWRDLVRVYRRMEGRGEIRGGRFVGGFGGEQFAAPDAVGRLRAVRRSESIGERIAVSAADPLNLVGILTPDARVPAIHTNRLLLEDGLPIAALEGGEIRRLSATPLSDDELRDALTRRTPARQAELHPRTLRGREAKAMANRTVH